MVRLTREATALLVIDIQERLLPVIEGGDQVAIRTSVAIQGAKVLGVPLLATEQYPRGLGATVPAVASALCEIDVPEKLSFSCLGAQAIVDALDEQQPATVIVAGIETHVCVSQTCLDLLDRGITPVVLADCTGSRHQYDHETALERLGHAGAVITTVEAALFELTGQAGTPEFKQISGLVKPL